MPAKAWLIGIFAEVKNDKALLIPLRKQEFPAIAPVNSELLLLC
jgi:hypothetical protein